MRSDSGTFNFFKIPLFAVIIVSIAAIALGLFFCTRPLNDNPIGREDAMAYSGEFQRYETSKNYKGIHFKDDSYYSVHPHSTTNEFDNKMKSLKQGTKLYILVNPNNDYVVEVRTDTEVLLNFEISQPKILSSEKSYIIVGVIPIICGILLPPIVFFAKKAEKDDEKKKNQKAPTRILRHADPAAKGKVLAEAQIAGGYTINYRRVKTVNELVVNGKVYDEKKGIIEWQHTLYAEIDGHKIEAGLDADSYSFIKFDGKTIVYIKRII